MTTVSLEQFKHDLKELAELSSLSNHDMFPWFYDIVEPLSETSEGLHEAIKVLSKCLNFFTIIYPVDTPLFYLEKHSFAAFARLLKIKHADSIEFFRTTNACMRCINPTFVSVFAELSNELVLGDTDSNDTRRKFTDILITLMQLSYSGSLPRAKVPDLTLFTEVPAMDLTYDIVHSLDNFPFILRMEEEEHFLYVNTQNSRSIRLDKSQALSIVYLIAILKTCSPTERMIDIAFYGVGGDDAYAILDMTNKEHV